MGSNKNTTTLNLEVGDVVRLRSGGPKMTVDAIGGLIACAWFTGGGHAKRGFFELEMLELASEPEDIT
jgi:uncharacterized protein YodC (DUF2158 family)